MELKELLGPPLLALATSAAIAIAACSQRVRDLCFVAMVWGTCVCDRLDINFVSRNWYRGSTRGFEFSFIDILALTVLGGSLLGGRRRGWRWPAGLLPILLYFSWAAVSVAMNEPRLFGLFELSKIVRATYFLLAAAVFVRGERGIRILVFAVSLTLTYEGLFALKSRYLDGLHRISGTLNHPNLLSMYATMLMPVCLAGAASTLPRRLRVFSLAGLGFATISVVLSISRAGAATFGLVFLGTGLACLRLSLRHAAAALLTLVVAAGVLYKASDTLEARYQEVSLSEEIVSEGVDDAGYVGRVYYWVLADIIIQAHPLGVGLNNWSYYVSNYVDPMYMPYEGVNREPTGGQAPPAHSLVLLTLGETGWPGLAALLLVFLRWLQLGAGFLLRRRPDPVSRFGLAAFFCTWAVVLQSQTEWEYRDMHVMMVFHVLMGALASAHWWRMRDGGRRRAGHLRAGPVHPRPAASVRSLSGGVAGCAPVERVASGPRLLPRPVDALRRAERSGA